MKKLLNFLLSLALLLSRTACGEKTTQNNPDAALNSLENEESATNENSEESKENKATNASLFQFFVVSWLSPHL